VLCYRDHQACRDGLFWGGLRAYGRMLGTLAHALTLVRAGFFPKRPSDLDWVDPRAIPPGSFVPGPMRGAVMCSTERYREFIAGSGCVHRGPCFFFCRTARSRSQ
jgi:hypothetical protein